MRSEIDTINLTKAAFMLKAATVTPSAVDAANGVTIPLDNRGAAGLVIIIKNNGAEVNWARILMDAPHLGSGANLAAPIPAGAARMIADIDSQRYGSKGRIDIDFDPGFTGEILAFRVSWGA